MASSLPLQTFDDDDDDFDWEAAAIEIDAACAQKANSEKGFCLKVDTNRPFSSRQSTLDNFFGSKSAKPVSEDAVNEGKDEGFCDDDGSVGGVKIDPEAAKTWIYPENIAVRDYQLSITRTALFSNTLVALPTGLGKTLIAAVVMYNYFRWFPEGKIVFAAPSRPLVMQQIEACHNIVGISQEWTVDMTGQTGPTKRVELWQQKRVFFVTPQVLERDIQAGSCTVKQIVCLVIDEAHRASGNYSYCVAVRELMAVPVQLRILALTATPGSDRKAIQQVIDNLQISSLEYRSETDADVKQYVNDRKIDFIQVEMGKDAVELNDLLVEVMRPFVEKLFSFRLIQRRDPQTLSPMDYLNAREKFRQAPPQELPQGRHGEMEGTYGVCIALQHIRKLLSAHGIQSAFEMLEDKLKQRYFANFLSRSESLQKAKLLMQQNLSHGALNPKFTKMLEVLVDHFKTHDAQKSRVIIFSHFRDSVRHIMNSLATIGEYVKAAEFIGQNSGKTSKGQSQKVQQAVLEKFRAGGYNVIVATSIGEEGLDIMEVDLVISFDSNISPLRMIQRMGRTGRKNKGRVVVLACEGSEVNGYKKKQGNTKSMKKLLQNGESGIFHFHSSPRMVPHVFRPEIKLVKFDIEEFVHRGKKVKDDDTIQTPKYKLKLTDAETDLLGKYFDSSGENTWKPSLIAFPHFQAFPSRVNKVSHSLRTTMLIDTMQYLQGLSFNGSDEETSQECFRVDTVEHHNSPTREDDLIQTKPESHTFSDMETSRTEEKQQPDVQSKSPPKHSFLFGSDFMSIDSVGRVLILSVPSFPLKQVSPRKSLNCLKSDFREFPEIPLDMNDDLLTSFKNINDLQEDNLAEDGNGVVQTEACKLGGGPNDTMIPIVVADDASCKNINDLQEDNLAEDDNRVLQIETCKLDGGSSDTMISIVVADDTSFKNINDLQDDNRVLQTETCKSDGGLKDIMIPIVVDDDTHSGDESDTDSKFGELSPRLTNLMMSGVVPESPIDIGTLNKLESCMTPEIDMLPNASISLVQSKDEKLNEITPSRRNVRKTEEIQTPVINSINNSSEKCASGSKFIGEFRTPLAKLSNNSCSKDWILSSGEKSVSQPKPRLKRLRKYGDIENGKLLDKENVDCHSSISGRSCARLDHPAKKLSRGDGKLKNDARVFIDDEAEASSEASGDEEVDEEDCYGGSFIDDRINPTMANTQAETAQVDMMAIYRRSLLTQSPIVDFSPGNNVSTDQTTDSGSAEATISPYLNTNGNSSSVHLSTNNTIIPINTGSSETNETRKRKLSFLHGESLPIRNLETEVFNKPEAAAGKVSWQMDRFDDGNSSSIHLNTNNTIRPIHTNWSSETNETQKRKLSFSHGEPLPIRNLETEVFTKPEVAAGKELSWQMDEFDDDEFYQGIDLDALEEQAAKLLRSKTGLLNEKPKNQMLELLDSPSFDLGI